MACRRRTFWHRLNWYAEAVSAHLPAPLADEVNGYVHWLIARQTALMDKQ